MSTGFRPIIITPLKSCVLCTNNAAITDTQQIYCTTKHAHCLDGRAKDYCTAEADSTQCRQHLLLLNYWLWPQNVDIDKINQHSHILSEVQHSPFHPYTHNIPYIWQQCTIFVMVLIKANRAITETQRIPKATTTTTNIIMKTKTLIINSHHIIGPHKLRVVGLITCKLRLMQRTESTK